MDIKHDLLLKPWCPSEQKNVNLHLNTEHLREAARMFRESKISDEKLKFFLFRQNIPFFELVSKKIF